MRFRLLIILNFLICSFVNGQNIDTKWYSESNSDGILIQNSLPKGGPYSGPVKQHYNYSYLVFFHRVFNGTGRPLEIDINFSAESTEIPNSPDTYVRLFLPRDTMTLDKQSLFSYGITKLESFDTSTRFQRILKPNEDCLFYVVAIFYQTEPGAWSQERGGNRAEFRLKDGTLYYRMPPQIEYLSSGKISYKK